MLTWRKRASRSWLAVNEAPLRELTGTRLAIIRTPPNKTSLLEVAVSSLPELKQLRRRFGGTMRKLPRHWLRRFTHQRTKPIKIGRRLEIVNSHRSRGGAGSRLLIPAGAAFGTGAHTTTAMSLRLLEQLTRGWQLRSPAKRRRLLDVGTGSGILALAAVRFGASEVTAIDSDPLAISTAKDNARLNGITAVQFKIANARLWRDTRKFDIIVANLFSELLVDILPRFRRARWLILSGILRCQQQEVVEALRRSGFALRQARKRGKWVALLAQQYGDT